MLLSTGVYVHVLRIAARGVLLIGSEVHDGPGRQIAIALDTKGPEIRTGNTEGDADLPISEGAVLNITTDEK